MRARIVIIGGGVLGTSIALHAAKRTDPLSEPVVLLERGELASGTSGSSGATLGQFLDTPSLGAMARDSLKYFSAFRGNTARPIGFRRCGVLTLAPSQGAPHEEAFLSAVQRARSLGIDIGPVTAERIRELCPGISVGDKQLGAFEPTAGFVDASRTVEALATLAKSAGTVLRLRTAVEELLVESGRVVGVRTSRGTIQAPLVVIAAGVWSTELLAGIGSDLPLEIVRPGQAFISSPMSIGEAVSDEGFSYMDQNDLNLLHPVLVDLEQGFCAHCEPEKGRTRVLALGEGSVRSLSEPDESETEADTEHGRRARAALVERLPLYEGQAETDGLGACITETPDSQAMVGPVPGFEGLSIVSGFSSHGFRVAPAVGEGVAQMLVGQPISAFDAEYFSPARFARGELRERTGPLAT